MISNEDTEADREANREMRNRFWLLAIGSTAAGYEFGFYAGIAAFFLFASIAPTITKLKRNSKEQ